MSSEQNKIVINQQWLEIKKDLVLAAIRKGNAHESSMHLCDILEACEVNTNLNYFKALSQIAYPFFSKVGDSSYIYAQTQITWLQKFFIHYVIALLHNEKNEALDSISKSTNASPNPQEFNEDETNDTEKSMGLRAKPVLGVVKLEGTDFKFYPYGKNGTPLKSKKINLSGRVYAKTEQESIEVYNFFVDEQIALLEELLANVKADRI